VDVRRRVDILDFEWVDARSSAANMTAGEEGESVAAKLPQPEPDPRQPAPTTATKRLLGPVLLLTLALIEIAWLAMFAYLGWLRFRSARATIAEGASAAPADRSSAETTSMRGGETQATAAVAAICSDRPAAARAAQIDLSL
jgi:hypothetical protein